MVAADGTDPIAASVRLIGLIRDARPAPGRSSSCWCRRAPGRSSSIDYDAFVAALVRAGFDVIDPRAEPHLDDLDDPARRPLGRRHARGDRAGAGRASQAGRRALKQTRHASASQSGRSGATVPSRRSSPSSARITRRDRLQGSAMYIPDSG